MSDKTAEYCPKCTTGTIVRFNRDEYSCTKCGKIFRTTKAAPQPKVTGPRPGGNRYAG
jgi:ribosomal protein S27AE